MKLYVLQDTMCGTVYTFISSLSTASSIVVHIKAAVYSLQSLGYLPSSLESPVCFSHLVFAADKMVLSTCGKSNFDIWLGRDMGVAIERHTLSSGITKQTSSFFYCVTSHLYKNSWGDSLPLCMHGCIQNSCQFVYAICLFWFFSDIGKKNKDMRHK